MCYQQHDNDSITDEMLHSENSGALTDRVDDLERRVQSQEDELVRYMHPSLFLLLQFYTHCPSPPFRSSPSPQFCSCVLYVLHLETITVCKSRVYQRSQKNEAHSNFGTFQP